MISGPRLRVLDLQQQAADALAGRVLLAGHLLLAGHHGLGLAEVDEEVAALAAAHDAGDDVADPVLEVVVDALLLELAELLHDRLPGGLGGDAAEVGGIDLLFDELAELGARLQDLRLLDVNLRLRIADGIDDLEQGPRMELAVLGVDLNLQLLAGVNPFLGRRLDGIDNRGDHVVATDPLLLLHVLEDGKDFAAHMD